MTPELLRSLDWAIHGGAFTLLILLAVLHVRDASRTSAAGLRILVVLGAAAFAVTSAAGVRVLLGAWIVPLRVLATGETVILWLCAQQQFDDRFRLRPWHGGVWGVVLVLSLGNCLLPRDSLILPWVNKLLSFQAQGFALLAAAQTLLSWRGDLVEERRAARAMVIAGAAGYCLLLPFLDLVTDYPLGVRWASHLVASAGLLLVAAAATWSYLRLSPDAANTSSLPAKAPPPPDATTLNLADRAVLAQLDRLMGVERIYRHEDLNIGALAVRLGVPEHRLRRLINRGLGHRNFAGFVNGYRLADARSGLADPQQAEVPIITVALDAGFASIGPFNRAFKADTGLTPSEFRAQAQAQAKPEPVSADLSASRIPNSA